MSRTLYLTFLLLLVAATSFAQSSFQGLTPGVNTRSDAERVLGQPVSQVSPTLIEYKGPQGAQQIYIQYRKESPLIERIEVLFNKPVDRSAVASLLGLPQQADTTKWDSKGRLEEYFAAIRLIVVTHDAGEAASPVSRVGYYSRELFEVALAKPQGQPQINAATPNRAGGSNRAPSQPAAGRSGKEIVIPEGTKINAVTAEKISSKTARVGDPLTLKVKDPVVIDGRIVIDKDATITGSITTADKSGWMGKDGKLAFKVESTTTVDGQEIKLRPSYNRGGAGEYKNIVLNSVFLGGMSLHGQDAVYKKGFKFKVYTDEEKRVRAAER